MHQLHPLRNRGWARIDPPWYKSVTWTIIGPVWAVGSFVLAIGFLAVPHIFLGSSLATWRAAATSRFVPFPWAHSGGPRTAGPPEKTNLEVPP